MAEILPCIDIAVSIDPTVFLERMAVLGGQAGKFAVDRGTTGTIEQRMDVLNFRLQLPSPHRGHGFQLIAHDDRPKRIDVEVRAERWSPEPLTKSIYVEAAHDLAGRLLKQYNQTYGTRYRLRISRHSGRSFKMTERTSALLKRFTVLANTRSLHFYDWQRFYVLVDLGRQEIPVYVFRSVLVEAGFSPARATELAEIYTHLWAFKRLR